MTWYIALLIGLAVGVEIGRRSIGRPFQWKKALIAFLIAAVLAAVIAWLDDRADRGGVVCTQEAKLCPDGSYVGRTGPHCEFAPCP